MEFVEYIEFSKGGTTLCLKVKSGKLNEVVEQFEGIVEIEAFQSLGMVVIEVSRLLEVGWLFRG